MTTEECIERVKKFLDKDKLTPVGKDILGLWVRELRVRRRQEPSNDTLRKFLDSLDIPR